MYTLREHAASGVTDESQVLNVVLYRRCLKIFGEVRITNPGERHISRYGPPPDRTESVVLPGEYYVVCCPICNDQRFRCYINHNYGVLDDFGRVRTWSVYCFNGGCGLQRKEKIAYDRMRYILLGLNFPGLPQRQIRPGKISNVGERSGKLPGQCVRIDQLPADHQAVKYLTERRFDVGKLAEQYDVQWCVSVDDPRMRLAENRIIIPVLMNSHLVGWQARLPFELDKSVKWPPKYYTAPGMRRQFLLYNIDNAVRYKSCAIVEGVTDVWRFDGPAVCTFGDRMTEHQIQLFSAKFAERTGVIVFDSDLFLPSLPREREKTKNDAIVTSLRLNALLRGGCCIVPTPVGYDPANMETAELRSYVVSEATKQNIRVDWGEV